MGNKVWEVFSTNEWETFAKIFHKRYSDSKNGDTIDGITITKVAPHADGRVRILVNLPHLDWVLSNLQKGRLDTFPVTGIQDEFHVPEYLNFVASLMNANTGSAVLDRLDKQICKAFGTAKLINISKKERKFTVIIYGICVNP